MTRWGLLGFFFVFLSLYSHPGDAAPFSSPEERALFGAVPRGLKPVIPNSLRNSKPSFPVSGARYAPLQLKTKPFSNVTTPSLLPGYPQPSVQQPRKPFSGIPNSIAGVPGSFRDTHYTQPTSHQQKAKPFSNLPSERPGRPGPMGRLDSVQPPGAIQIDIYGNIFMRTSPRVAFREGDIVYRSISGWVKPDQKDPFSQFSHVDDRIPNFDPDSYTFRWATQDPQASKVGEVYSIQRQQQHEAVQRYRNSLPQQYQRQP